MHRIIIALSLFVLFTLASYSQEWIRGVGGSAHEMGVDVEATNDGGFIVGGRWDTTGRVLFWVARFDGEGILQWDSTYGDPGRVNTLMSIEPGSNGSFLLSGYSSVIGGDRRASMYAIDSVGRTLWTKEIDYDRADEASFLVEVPDGYVMGGRTLSLGDTLGDRWLVKMDPQRHIVWQKTYSMIDDDIAYAGRPTADGGWIIVGSSYVPSERERSFAVVKTNDTGGVEWQRLYHSDFMWSDRALSVDITQDGNYALIGPSRYVHLSTADSVWLLVLDPKGEIVTDRHYNPWFRTEGRTGIETSDGGFLMTGMAFPRTQNFEELFVIKTDSRGEVLWQRTLGADYSEAGFASIEVADGYILVGSTDSPRLMQGTNGDLLIVKINKNGDVVGISAEGPSSVTGRHTVSPNPASRSGSVTFDVSGASTTVSSIRIIDGRGATVRLLEHTSTTVDGDYRMTWDLAGEEGARVPAALYFYVIDTSNGLLTGKMVVTD